MTTEVANESNEWLGSREVEPKLPLCIVDAMEGRHVIGLARLPFVDVLHLRAAGTPEAHPDYYAFAETEFGHAVAQLLQHTIVHDVVSCGDTYT